MDKFKISKLSLSMADGGAIHYGADSVVFESGFRKGKVISYKLSTTADPIKDPEALTQELLNLVGKVTTTPAAITSRMWNLGPCSRPTIKSLSNFVQVDSAQLNPDKGAPQFRFQWVRLFMADEASNLRTTMIRVANVHRIRLRDMGSDSRSGNIFPIPDTAYLAKTMMTY